MRLLALGAVLVGIASANPLTITITGAGSGTLGSTRFSNATFKFVMTADTGMLVNPTCCPNDIETAQGSPTTFSITGVGSGTLMDTQVVFIDPSGTAGLAHANDGDMIDLDSQAFNGYQLNKSLGPVTGTPFIGGAAFTTSAGTLMVSSGSTVTFTFTVSAAPAGPTITKVTDDYGVGSTLTAGMPILITGTGFGTDPNNPPTVQINNETALLFAFNGGTQIIAFLPPDLSPGTDNLTVGAGAAVSAAFPVTIAAVAPVLAATNTFSDPSGNPITSTNQAAANMQITALALGLGPTNPVLPPNTNVATKTPTTMPVTVMIGNKMVTADYAGYQVGSVSGFYQVVFTVPADVAMGPQPVTITVGGVTSNAETLNVGPPIPIINAIVNGATFKAGPAAANSFVSLFGSNFGSENTPGNIFPATSFMGISVLVNEVAIPLYVVAGTGGQINVVLPSELAESGTAQVQVMSAAGTSAVFDLPLAPTAVGIFRIADPSKPTRMNGAVLFSNTAWKVMPLSMATALGFPLCSTVTTASVCGKPAKVGDQVQIYLTGLGKATPNGDPNGKVLPTGSLAPTDGSVLYKTVAMPTVTVGGVPATVSFSGIAPGNAGQYQINLEIPSGVNPGDDVPLVVTMPDGSTDTVTIAVQAS
jgi:uncharacterized protein (TIGR03437 family)